MIGFRGLLMSDDVSMGALTGSIGDRSRAALEAGCDLVLHCNGKLDEMREVAEAAPVLRGEAAIRSIAALKLREKVEQGDHESLRKEFFDLMAQFTEPGMAAS